MKCINLPAIVFIILLSSCSVHKQLSRSAQTNFHDAPGFQTAHIGISIFEPATGKQWFDYQGDKYFVPASNTKIPTCYIAMKYLGDSLKGIGYRNTDSGFLLFPTADPTLLHNDFPLQRVVSFLKNSLGKLSVTAGAWKEEALGSGWSWNDYDSDYMAERSALPVYGNIVTWTQVSQPKENPTTPEDTTDVFVFAEPDHDWEFSFDPNPDSKVFIVRRGLADNTFTITGGKEKKAERRIPFHTPGMQTAIALLADSVGKKIVLEPGSITSKPAQFIYSQSTDSMLKLMMHRSDNFFAEQSLLMVSYERLGLMNDARIIDTILKTDFSELPQRPRWVDGSGLSRYNLFTPRDMVAILDKMQREFGMERLKVIFPTGGEGTIRSYYTADSGYIYGKTGTLSGVVAFSGFLYTKQGKLLIFSTLVNNHQASPIDIRRAVEKFLLEIRAKN